MLINRRTFVTKHGRSQDATEFLKNGANHLDWVPPLRVSTSHFGSLRKVQLELEFESLADYEKFWTAFEEAPESQAVLEKWWECIEAGGTTNEIWKIA